MGDLHVLEEEKNILGRKIIARQLRGNGTGDLANNSGVFLTKARVKILKVIKARLPSYSSFLCQNLLVWEGGVAKSSVSCFLINSLKSISQQGSFRVAQLWSLRQPPS